MSSLKYNNPSGGINEFAKRGYYSQSVDLGNGIVKISGQGGWSVEEGPLGGVPESAQEQIEAAFKNIDHVLKSAGLNGVGDVYLVRSYHTDIDESLGIVTEVVKKLIPTHMPIWTAVGTSRLAMPTMKIEIEVEAKRSSA